MKKRFKPTYDDLDLKQVGFLITIADYLELLKAATRAKMTVSDLLRSRLGYDTAKQLKEKRLNRNNSYFIH
jgi:hypothetical protein